LVADPKTQAVIGSILQDESRHIAYLNGWLKRFEQRFSRRAVAAAAQRLEATYEELDGLYYGALHEYLEGAEPDRRRNPMFVPRTEDVRRLGGEAPFRRALAVLSRDLFLARATTRLHVEVDPDRQLPQDHPFIQTLNDVHRIFGDKNLVVIGLFPHDGNVFTPAS